MGRLIDADKLIEEIRNEGFYLEIEQTVEEIINDTSTTYDVDEVVKELEFELGQYDEGLTEIAIEIVKEGGKE